MIALASSLLAVLVLSGTSSAMAVPGMTPSSDLCGRLVVADLVLDHDLVCPGSGLVVGADGIEIDLNNHSISGPGRGTSTRGITIMRHADVTIKGPGVVTSFRTGILIFGSTEVEIKKVTVSNNGLAEFSDGDGIRVFGSSGLVIEKCIILGNGNDGIQVGLSTRVELVKNKIIANGNGIALSGMGFEIEKNHMIANTCAIKGTIAGNEFDGNHFKYNTADFCA